MKQMWSRVNELWCKSMHPAPMWPVNGQYRCPSCQRVYPVAWETETRTARSRPVAAAKTHKLSGARAHRSDNPSSILPALSR